MKCITYKKGYKYQLQEYYSVFIPELVGVMRLELVPGRFIRWNKGVLNLSPGYAWDGPSGPTVDTKTFMRGSLVHDALYQLMREEVLPRQYRKLADKVLYRMCREDKMMWVRAAWVYVAVRLFAGFAADPASKKPVLFAPSK